MLSVRLQHRLGDFALDVDFEAPPGITVLFGRSGSGKTSIVNAVAGLLTPDEGRVALADRVLLDTGGGINLPPQRRRIGYVFQEGRLFPHLTVRQNLTYGRLFAPRGAPREDPDRIIAMLGLEPLLQRRPGRLSGGEKQRVAIGRALLANPKLILADEPLASLDAARKEDILPYFERLRDETDIRSSMSAIPRQRWRGWPRPLSRCTRVASRRSGRRQRFWPTPSICPAASVRRGRC